MEPVLRFLQGRDPALAWRIVGDIRERDDIPDNSVALVVTSPPYFAGKQYEEELEREAASAKRWITVDSGCAHRLRSGRSEPFAEAVLAKLADGNRTLVPPPTSLTFYPSELGLRNLKLARPVRNHVTEIEPSTLRLIDTSPID